MRSSRGYCPASPFYRACADASWDIATDEGEIATKQYFGSICAVHLYFFHVAPARIKAIAFAPILCDNRNVKGRILGAERMIWGKANNVLTIIRAPAFR
jgi:hypothetical protein